MRQIIFATHNKHKTEEIQQLVKDKIEIVSLDSLGERKDIPETGDTLKENARQKATYVYENTAKTVLQTIRGLKWML